MIGRVRQKIHFLCMDLPQSDACFVKAYSRRPLTGLLADLINNRWQRSSWQHVG